MNPFLCLLFAQQPLDLLPQPALAVAAWEQPARTVADVAGGELLRRATASGLWEALRARPEAALAAFAWMGVSAPVGGDPARFAEALAGGGIAAALLARGEAKPGLLAVARMGEPEIAEDILIQLARLARVGDGAVRGAAWELPFGEAFLARAGDWLVFASDAAWIAGVRARLADFAAGAAVTAAPPPSWAALRARAQAGERPASAWAWISGAAVRANGFAPLPDDLGASLLGGDLHEALRVCDWAGLTLRVGGDGLRAELIVPEPATLAESHAPFRPGAQEISFPVLRDGIARGALLRDFGGWYNARDLYANAAAVAGSVEGDGNARLLFGRDFGPDVLAWLEPQARLIVARNPDAAQRALELELPAGAIGLRLKADAPPGLRQGFVNAFLAAVTFANFQAGSADEKQLLLDLEKDASGGALYVARRPRLADGASAPLAHNAEPALFVGADGEIWIGSSVGLLREILAAPVETVGATASWIEADFSTLADLVEHARGAIVARRLLKAGGDFDAAGRFADLVIAGARLLDGATLRLGPDGGFCALALELRATPEAADDAE